MLGKYTLVNVDTEEKLHKRFGSVLTETVWNIHKSNNANAASNTHYSENNTAAAATNGAPTGVVKHEIQLRNENMILKDIYTLTYVLEMIDDSMKAIFVTLANSQSNVTVDSSETKKSSESNQLTLYAFDGITNFIRVDGYQYCRLNEMKYYMNVMNALRLTLNITKVSCQHTSHLWDSIQRTGRHSSDALHSQLVSSTSIDIDCLPSRTHIRNQRKSYQFSKLCYRIFGMIEIYYNQSLPLFCQDDTSLDVTITYENVQLLEVVLFMLSLIAIESENKDGVSITRSGENTSRGGGSVSSSIGTTAPNMLNSKGSYFLKCEAINPLVNDNASSDASEQLNAKSIKKWKISLKKLTYGPPGVQRTERRRERRQRRSSKYRSKSPEGSPGVLTRQNSNRSENTIISTGSGTSVNSAGGTNVYNKSSEILRRMLNIITIRYFDTRIHYAPYHEEVTPGVISQTWELVLVSANEEELSNYPVTAIQISPYIKPFAPTQAHTKEDLMSSDNPTESNTEDSSRVQLNDVLREDGTFKNSWLYVDSHLGDSMKLFTIRTGFESLGVPLTTCPMHNLHKHSYCHPVVILYEGMLGEYIVYVCDYVWWNMY